MCDRRLFSHLKVFSELTEHLILRGSAMSMIYDITDSLEVSPGPFSANTSVHIL